MYLLHRVVTVIFRVFRGELNVESGKCLPVQNIHVHNIIIPTQTLYAPHIS